MRAAGIQAADKLKQMPWRQALLELAELVKPYIRRYQALEAAAPTATSRTSISWSTMRSPCCASLSWQRPVMNAPLVRRY